MKKGYIIFLFCLSNYITVLAQNSYYKDCNLVCNVKSCDELNYKLIDSSNKFQILPIDFSNNRIIYRFDICKKITMISRNSSTNLGLKFMDSTKYYYNAQDNLYLVIYYSNGKISNKEKFVQEANTSILYMYSCIADTNGTYLYTTGRNLFKIRKPLRGYDTCKCWNLEKKYIYDKKENLIEEQPVNSSFDTSKYLYDNKGYLVYAKHGTYLEFIYENNKEGKPVKSYELKYDGTKELRVDYKYNCHGLLVRERWFKSNSVFKSYYYDYKYDKYGNWTRRIGYVKNTGESKKKPSKLTLRVFEYYSTR